MKKSAAELQSELQQFSGTSQYFQHPLGLLYTDGVQYLAHNADCYWLLDIICSYRHVKKIREQDFLVHKLQVNEKNRSAIYAIENGNGLVLQSQHIEFTDFPLTTIKLFQEGAVILLPSEH